MQIRDYFRDDVIPILEEQQENCQRLATPFPPVNVFPPLLLTVGILVIIYSALMLMLTQRSTEPAPAGA
jgi:hypothetical protein